jgi:hypothetical protein
MTDYVGRTSLLVATAWMAVYASSALGQDPEAQPPVVPAWQIAAGGKMAFEVASVKPDPGAFRPPNFPLSDNDSYGPVGGRFSADTSRSRTNSLLTRCSP